ncbi:hypothetical protein R3W88_026617 [Solanum pinnatisectum]|uniref:RRM domain-containing protein n=1 Tax=Solanum pinnatisectum TaxID=50273 RepID=A0AAV9LF32_9SOLN|nr:hypothetical protein R3W88_026617 [Solanum pinnatisectum]
MSEEMYYIFGKYGAIRRIHIDTTKDTRGTAFIVYEDIYDAKPSSIISPPSMSLIDT